MADTTSIFIALGAALSGAGLAWLFARQYAVAAEARAREEASAERLALSTRLATAEERAARVPVLAAELAEREKAFDALREAKSALDARIAELTTQLAEEREQGAEKLAVLDDAQKRLTDAFHALSAQALQKNNAAFLDLANATLEKFQEKASGDLAKKEQAIAELLKPVRESLARVDMQMQEIEKTRAGAYEGLIAQVKSLAETQQQLRGETGQLVRALHSPVARGRWGEIQLRRVVELAGMLDHCDFFEQQSVEGEVGRLRPDMLVKMPGGKMIVVDSKVPFSAYYRAFEAADQGAKRLALIEHAKAVREHAKALATKAYWEQFDEAPEFVVLFLPGEAFFGAALEHDPELIEFGAAHRVILATPTTLIALLRAVHYGWRQEKLAENAQQISDLGRELYERLATLGEHMARLGRHLNGAVETYNNTVSSLETRVLVGARRFKELQAAPDKELKAPVQIEQTTRTLQAPELVTEGANDDDAGR